MQVDKPLCIAKVRLTNYSIREISGDEIDMQDKYLCLKKDGVWKRIYHHSELLGPPKIIKRKK